MILKRIIILVCVCICFALLISCAEKNEWVINVATESTPYAAAATEITGATEPDKANISGLSYKINGKNCIAELFVTKKADDGSSATYAFYMRLKG